MLLSCLVVCLYYVTWLINDVTNRANNFFIDTFASSICCRMSGSRISRRIHSNCRWFILTLKKKPIESNFILLSMNQHLCLFQRTYRWEMYCESKTSEHRCDYVWQKDLTLIEEFRCLKWPFSYQIPCKIEYCNRQSMFEQNSGELGYEDHWFQ